MLKEINDIYSLIAFILIAITVLTVVLLFLKKAKHFSFKKGDLEIGFGKEIKEPISTVLPEKEDKKYRSLCEHVFFHELLKWEKRTIPGLVIHSELKKMVIIEFLTMMISLWRETFIGFIEHAEMEITNHTKCVCDEIIPLYLHHIEEYNKRAKELEIKRKGKIMKGLPDLFLKKFDEWHTPHVDMTIDILRQIINNELYDCERTKLLAIVEVFYLTFKLTILDAGKTINSLNGELERILEKQLGG